MDDLQKQERIIRDIQARDYESVRRKAYFRWFEVSERLIIRGLLKGHQGWLLDAACSTGRMTPTLKKISPRVVSVDFSLGSLKFASRNHPGSYYIQADLAALPFKAVFSEIICLDTLHCIPPGKRAAAAGALADVLRPGGLLLASIWNRASFTRIFRLPPEGRFKSGIYYQALEESRVKEMFSCSGLKDIRICGLGYFIYFVRSLRFTSRLYRWTGWLTVPLEKLLTLTAPPMIRNKAMYFILKAYKSDE